MESSNNMASSSLSLDEEAFPDVGMWFPHDVATWVKTNSTRLGVPDPYIGIPLLVTLAYLSRKSIVKYVLEVNHEENDILEDQDEGASTECIDLHIEPLILYGVVAGDRWD